MKRQFSLFLGLSLLLHLGVVALLTLRFFFFPSKSLQFERAIKVDMVGLPDKQTNEELATAVSHNPSPRSPPAEVNLSDQKIPDRNRLLQKQKEAIRHLKTLSAIDRIRQQVADTKSQTELEKGKIKRTNNEKKSIKGDRITLSGGSSGKLLDPKEEKHQEYLAQLERHVRQNWTLPEWMARLNLKAQVKIKVDFSGLITSRVLTKSSGNPQFDDMVMEAVKRSSPVPRPPSDLVSFIGYQGITLGFPD